MDHQILNGKMWSPHVCFLPLLHSNPSSYLARPSGSPASHVVSTCYIISTFYPRLNRYYSFAPSPCLPLSPRDNLYARLGANSRYLKLSSSRCTALSEVSWTVYGRAGIWSSLSKLPLRLSNQQTPWSWNYLQQVRIHVNTSPQWRLTSP